MEKALEIQRKVQEILQSEEVYLVGGSVRDLVMGQEPKDYDFTTSLTPDEMKPRIKAAGRRVYNIGNGEKHGTVTFKVPITNPINIDEEMNGSPTGNYKIEYEYVEVTTHRTEVYDGKSRQPQTTFGVSLDEDLMRRDFTMNAMVLRNDGSIYDPFGGKLDIYARQIKTVGMPKDRIMEDPLRILRAARFAARYGYRVDSNFVGKARQLATRILDVSRERWVLELDKMLMGEYHNVGVELLEEMGVLRYMIPELSFMLNQHAPHNGTEYQKQHYTFDMEMHHANPIFFPEDNVDARWKKWLQKTSMPVSRRYTTYGYINMDEQVKIAREINAGICARLKFSNDRTDFILDKHKKKG